MWSFPSLLEHELIEQEQGDRMPLNPPTITLTPRGDYHYAIRKIQAIQRLANGAISQQDLQAYESNLLRQTPKLPNGFNFGIDLAADNIVAHLSKLWLMKQPDQSFFQVTHPALLKLRQELTNWQQSRRWRTWSEFQADRNHPKLSYFDFSLLPIETECRNLFQRFIASYNWYFELLTLTRSNLAQAKISQYHSSGCTPSSPEQWTLVALSLAICRLSLSAQVSDWTSKDGSEERRRYEKISNWCDLSVMALLQAGFNQNPTVEGIRILIILTTTTYFESDCGLMRCAPQILKLHEVALEMSERLNLHRDPPDYFSLEEKEDRRRIWWTLVTIDSYFCSIGAKSKGVVRLQNSNTRLPTPHNKCQVGASVPHVNYSYLRSSRSRFEIGKFNNKCCQLLAQRSPLPTLSDIWKLDQDLVALEENIPIEHRWGSKLGPIHLIERELRPLKPMDDTLRNGQMIFYITLWHTRIKAHRGLLYSRQAYSSSGEICFNMDAHRNIVRRCCYSLLILYRHANLPSGFPSAIASAALTLLLELIQQPSQPYSHEIRTIVLQCFARLQTISSPVMIRACHVLEYFLQHLQPNIRSPSESPPGLSKYQKFEPHLSMDEGYRAAEYSNPSWSYTAQNSPSETSKEHEKTSIIDSSPGSSVYGRNKKSSRVNFVPNVTVDQRGPEPGYQYSELISNRPSVLHSENHTRTVLINASPMLGHTGAVVQPQDPTQDYTFKEFLAIDCGSAQRNLAAYGTSDIQVEFSDLVKTSEMTSTEGYNMCFASAQPFIDFANSISQITHHELLTIGGGYVPFQYREALPKSSDCQT